MKNFHIIWVNGPHKGSVHDIQIARAAIVNNMVQGEKGLGDKAYIGSEHFWAPYKPAQSSEQRKYNITHHKYHQNIERINRRLKSWHILKACYRGEKEAHHFVFYVLCYITNIVLQERPL